MKLLALTVENFRGVPNGTYDFAHPATKQPMSPVFITGGPSSGKTSLLDAIATLKEAVGAYGAPPDVSRFLRSGASSGQLSGTWLLSPVEMELAKVAETTLITRIRLPSGDAAPSIDPAVRALFERYSDERTAGKFEYFPSNRRLPAGRPGATPQPSLPLSMEAALRLTKREDKYALVRNTLVELGLRDGLRQAEMVRSQGLVMVGDGDDLLRPYRVAVASLLDRVRLDGVEIRAGVEVRFVDRAGASLELDELSDGEKQAVLFAIAFHRLGLSHSVVLVDDVELHVHPRDHAAWVHQLGGLGQENQLFLATCAPEIIRLASPSQVIQLGPGASPAQKARS